MPETKRLYYFTKTKWALKAIRDRRLKGSELDDTNDLFDLRPYKEDSGNPFQEYAKWRAGLHFRMLCLSSTCTNPVMWGHYADNGKGMCLGFDVIVDCGGLVPKFIEVDYRRDRIESGYRHPQLKGRQSMLAVGLNYGLVKHSEWKYEKEWRAWRSIKDEPPEPYTGLYYFPFEGWMTLREILIGPRIIEDSIRGRLEKLTANYDPKPEIVATDLSSSHFLIVKPVRDEL